MKNLNEDSIAFIKIEKTEFKNTYTSNEYGKLINESAEKSGDKLESIKVDFISDINYLFNINQLEEINDLSSL